MSFDLYFLKPGPDGTWDDAMAALEEAAEEEMPWTDQHQASWDEIEQRVRTVLPQAEIFVRDRGRQLDQQASGIQLSMAPGEISLTVPYWYDGPDADQVIGLLQAVAHAVEEATGLVAFDPQADQPFLDGGAAAAPGSFQQASAVLADLATESPAGSRQSSRWSRLFGRRG